MLGFNDGNSQGYINLANTASDTYNLIGTDAEERAHLTTSNEYIAESANISAQAGWKVSNFIHGDSVNSNGSSQESWNNNYANNTILQHNANIAAKVPEGNRDYNAYTPDATMVLCKNPVGCAAGVAIDVGELVVLGAKLATVGIGAKEASDIIKDNNKEGFDSTENNGSILSTPENHEDSVNILSTPINEDNSGNILSTPVSDNDLYQDQGFGVGSDVTDTSVLYNKDHEYVPAPKDLQAFPDAQRSKPKTFNSAGKKRIRWKDNSGDIYEWDSQHGAIEKYNKTGKKHLGEFDPITGKQTKPSDPTRKIEP